MQELAGRIRAKLDLNLRMQSDHALEMNDLLMKIESEDTQNKKLELQLREHIAGLESELKSLRVQLEKQTAIEEDEQLAVTEEDEQPVIEEEED